MAQMNRWKGGSAYDIASPTDNLADAFYYNWISWKYAVRPADICHMDIHISPWLCMNSVWTLATPLLLSRSKICWHLQILNAAPILCNAITSNDRTFTHNFYVSRSHMEWHRIWFRFSVLDSASTKGCQMSRVFFWRIRFCSMRGGSSQPPILPSIQSVVDRSC